MADPLSITASILAVTGAAAACTKTINFIIQTSRKAPAEVQSLNNELSELQILLSRVEDADRTIQQTKASVAAATRSNDPTLRWDDDLLKILDKARNRIASLNRLLDEVAAAQITGKIKLARIWFVRRDDIVAFKEDMRQLRTDLLLLLSAHILNSSSRIELSVTGISLQTASTEQSNNALVQETDFLRHSQSRIQASVDQLRQPTDEIAEKQTQILQGVQDLVETFRSSSAPKVTDFGPRKSHPTSGNLDTYFKVTAETVGCSQYCICTCHHRSSIATPGVLRHIIGFLFIGYVGSPVFKTKKCSQKSCKGQGRSSVHVTYYFPSWWMNRVLIGAADVSNQGISNARITYQARVQLATETILWAAAWGNLDFVKLLLQNRQARPDDMDIEDDVSALHLAVVNNRVEMCRFLLHWGADPNLSSIYGVTPAKAACALALGHKNPSQEINSIAELFDIHEYIEQEEFTHIHKVVLNLALGNLDDQLQSDTSLIDVPDASGRTPLWWAASRGDAEKLKILIQHGADFDFPDHRSRAPLHITCESGHSECVDLLLAAGANHTARDRTGFSPLAVWAWSSYADTEEISLSIGRSLIKAGTDPNVRDNDLVTPLMNAASYNQHLHARFLLENGADPDALNCVGQSALTYAVRNNGHETLRLLHEYGAKHAKSSGNGVSPTHVVHIAAESANLETLEILRTLYAEPLSQLDLDLVGYDDSAPKSAAQMAAERDDAQEFLVAFEEFLSCLRNYKAPSGKTFEENPVDKLHQLSGKNNRASRKQPFKIVSSLPFSHPTLISYGVNIFSAVLYAMPLYRYYI
ncbi:hypothetical protein H072_11240 [Dactylellina haptotyla CBS 200.50]|uniref:Azaphilone pigments biosynthesis cluster protein L N-terminal domain-containing protein n=1 Tax=Dactylellina haptotyla (strain CBS 200.50) TaxID=1284197 RepID=S8A2L5_DACHA|nr:hypothetical protein H072_11240 [Dactylellina haptotyla CBS 200.50]